MKTLKASAEIAVILAILAATGCGRPSEREQELAAGMKPVTGLTGYGTQCLALGTYSDPTPMDLGLWDCPDVDDLVLSEPPQPLVFSADCKKKLITIRSADRKLDTTWETKPDGTFDVTVPGGSTHVESDSSGNNNCVSYLSLNVYGTLKCGDPNDPNSRDRVDMDISSAWLLNQGKAPEGAHAPVCHYNNGCYLKTHGRLRQCG